MDLSTHNLYNWYSQEVATSLSTCSLGEVTNPSLQDRSLLRLVKAQHLAELPGGGGPPWGEPPPQPPNSSLSGSHGIPDSPIRQAGPPQILSPGGVHPVLCSACSLSSPVVVIGGGAGSRSPLDPQSPQRSCPSTFRCTGG